jgi:transposase
MYLRTKRVKSAGRIYEYLALCESVREGSRVRQVVVANLGRKDLLDPARIDSMVRALDPLTANAAVFDLEDDAQGPQESLQYGPMPILQRLWEDLGIGPLLRKAAKERDVTAPLERAAFAMVAARFLHPASKRDTFRNWLDRVYAPDLKGLSLHHLYRALDLLERNIGRIERTQWARVRTIWNPSVDLVLVDTTNTYVHGGEHASLAQYGKSKDKRYDRKIVSVGILVTRDGVPIGHEVFPGNTHDAKAFTQLLASLRERFQIGRVMLCADRGMVSDEILAQLRKEKIEYVVGSRMTTKAEAALSYPGAPWQELEDLGIRVKELMMGDEAYVVVHNPEEEVHDRERRREIVARLRATLKKNPSGSSLLRNSLYRPYVRLSGQVVRLDREAIERRRRYDGKYVLRANTALGGTDIARAYRQLYQVERAFRELKGPFEMRPIYHYVDRRIRAHVAVCFLAYVLEMAIRQALGKAGVLSEKDYRAVMEDLRRLGVVEITTRRGRYMMRTALRGRAFEAFAAVGMRVPPKVLERLGTTDPPPQAAM